MNLGENGWRVLLLSRNRGLHTVILVLVTSFFVCRIEMGWCCGDFRLSGPGLHSVFVANVRTASTFMGIDGALGH